MLTLDTFLKLVDRVIALVKERQQTKAQVFEEIVEPLFVELQPVVDDYFKLFRHAKDAVENSQKSNLSSAVIGIKNAREAMLLNRIKVREMAATIGEHDIDKRVKDFADKVESFFYRTITEKSKDKRSYATELIDICDYVLREDMNKADLIQFISTALRKMEETWVAIAQSYASARVHCLNRT